MENRKLWAVNLSFGLFQINNVTGQIRLSVFLQAEIETRLRKIYETVTN